MTALSAESFGSGVMTASTPACSAVRVSKFIDGVAALRAVTLDIGAGEAVALLGANGAGKSTLLRLLSTLATPTSGELRLFGERVGVGACPARARVGLVGHQAMLYRDLSVRENMALFARLHGVADGAARVRWLLQQLDLEDVADRRLHGLSRGTVQRAALARALVHDPELLLADEPFAGLDGASAARVERLLASRVELGRTLVMADHDIARALRICTRVVVLRAGAVSLDAPGSRVRDEGLREAMGDEA